MKNNKYILEIVLFFIIIAFSYLTYILCYSIAEKYFFDKFFYYKDIKYGYWVTNLNLSLANFGERAKDIYTLNQQNQCKVINQKDPKIYKIAIIGDSFVWGQGIKNNERFAKLLENKLNQVRPTSVISLGNCGDNIFDNYAKYVKSNFVFGEMDLYIFGLFNNDLLFNTDNRYNSDNLINKIAQGCNGNKIFDPKFNPDGTNQDKEYWEAITNSLNSSSYNYCAYHRLVPLLPTDKSIYINLGKIHINNIQDEFSKIISNNLNMLDYQINERKLTRVSQSDGHPSVYSNKVFSDVLYQEITSKNKYGFIQ